jgi:hypothetical protein
MVFNRVFLIRVEFRKELLKMIRHVMDYPRYCDNIREQPRLVIWLIRINSNHQLRIYRDSSFSFSFRIIFGSPLGVLGWIFMEEWEVDHPSKYVVL